MSRRCGLQQSSRLYYICTHALTALNPSLRDLSMAYMAVYIWDDTGIAHQFLRVTNYLCILSMVIDSTLTRDTRTVLTSQALIPQDHSTARVYGTPALTLLTSSLHRAPVSPTMSVAIQEAQSHL